MSTFKVIISKDSLTEDFDEAMRQAESGLRDLGQDFALEDAVVSLCPMVGHGGKIPGVSFAWDLPKDATAVSNQTRSMVVVDSVAFAPHEYRNAASLTVNADGALFVDDADGKVLAVFAPGQWARVDRA